MQMYCLKCQLPDFLTSVGIFFFFAPSSVKFIGIPILFRNTLNLCISSSAVTTERVRSGVPEDHWAYAGAVQKQVQRGIFAADKR